MHPLAHSALRNAAAGLALPLLAAMSVLPARPVHAQKTIESFFQTNLKDLTAELEVTSKNDAELRKIGKGYTDAYSLSKKTFWYKEPGKCRFEGKKGLITIRMVTSGDKKLTAISFPPVRKIADLKKDPDKADSISDIGLLTPDWLPGNDYKWLRTEPRDGKNLEVFQAWSKTDKRYRHTFWIDPQTKTIVEHIAHHRAKKKPGFKRRFVFSAVKQINGVYVPTQVTVYNTENKAAGSMRYESIKINTGLSDSLFKI